MGEIENKLSELYFKIKESDSNTVQHLFMSLKDHEKISNNKVVYSFFRQISKDLNTHKANYFSEFNSMVRAIGMEQFVCLNHYHKGYYGKRLLFKGLFEDNLTINASVFINPMNMPEIQMDNDAYLELFQSHHKRNKKSTFAYYFHAKALSYFSLLV